MSLLREWFGIVAALLLAAVLEAGGDALVRYGLRTSGSLKVRILSFALGALVLFAYSLSVNAPKWDFGRLLGVYIALFFVVAQVMAVLIFKETLKLPTLVGGALIVAGGLVLTLWHVKSP